jgi:CheY-like chemotaxis protein
MPGRDGFELVTAIRADPALRSLPVLMLTSAGQRGDAARCRELGVGGYLTKPVSRSDFLEAVSAVLGGMTTGTESLVTRHTLTEARQRLRVLLADDNPVNQEVAVTMLRRRGHQVDAVENGRQAVEAVRRERYDVVLMDIQMPEMDGFEATAAIRALPEFATLPIIALTAHALSGERENCLAHGLNGYLAKPFKTHELFAAVERWGAGAGDPDVPAAKTEAPAVVNLDILREQLRAAGSEEAIDGIVDTFLKTVPGRVSSLSAVLTSGAPADVARAAHTLKSSAGAIGAQPLATLLADVEARGRAGALGDREALAARVRDAATRVLDDLRAYRTKAA